MGNIHKKLFLIYEGISGAGKSSLLTEMMHKRNFIDYAIHRASATEWVYGSLTGRPIGMDDIYYFEESMQSFMPTVFILCHCDPAVAIQRKREQGDKFIEKDIYGAATLFDFYYEKLTRVKFKIKINSELPMKQNIENLAYFLNDVEKQFQFPRKD